MAKLSSLAEAASDLQPTPHSRPYKVESGFSVVVGGLKTISQVSGTRKQASNNKQAVGGAGICTQSLHIGSCKVSSILIDDKAISFIVSLAPRCVQPAPMSQPPPPAVTFDIAGLNSL